MQNNTCSLVSAGRTAEPSLAGIIRHSRDVVENNEIAAVSTAVTCDAFRRLSRQSDHRRFRPLSCHYIRADLRSPALSVASQLNSDSLRPK